MNTVDAAQYTIKVYVHFSFERSKKNKKKCRSAQYMLKITIS